MSEDQYIITTLLRAQLHEAREAIRVINVANMGILQGTIDHSDLEDAINAAVALLPESEKVRVQEKKVRQKRQRAGEKFEDLF